ncbi:MAG TPA: M20/M25/M40 family metallo-hydrolase, partial [Spirochaetia bacterium]
MSTQGTRNASLRAAETNAPLRVADTNAPLRVADTQQAARLARAISIPTITPLPDAPADAEGYRAFDELVALLRAQFPRAASTLSWERLGPLALLLHWQGTANEPPLALYAHGDVVPAGDEAAWSRPPFGGEVADGAVWGRGTLDDKCSLLAIMEAVEELLAAGYAPRRTALIAVGGDEELEGSRGAGVIAETLRGRGVR